MAALIIGSGSMVPRARSACVLRPKLPRSVIHPSFYVEEMAWVLYACHTILCYKNVMASRLATRSVAH
jgi:hypothetical protein